jgi:hypothetical protein
VTAAAAASLIALFVYAALTSAPWRLGGYTVRGAGYLTPEEVLAAAGLTMGENLFALDCGGAARRLSASPRIKSARVERRLPGEVVITIEERPAAAAVILNGEPYKVAADGVALEPLSTGYEELTWLVGTQFRVGGDPRGKRLNNTELAEGLKVVEAFGAAGPEWLAGVDYVDVHSRTVVMGGGWRKVRYGAGFDAAAARRVWRVYLETTPLAAGEVVYDCRFGDDVVVTGISRGATAPAGGGPSNGGQV